MANRYDIIHIDFQASAKGANAAIESIRKEADSCNTRISELKKNIAEAPKGTDAKILEGWGQELKVAERRYRQLTQAQKELMKGMRALDEGVKMFNDGSLQEMNAAFQKTVNNAAKLAQSKLTTGSKEWRQMGALMQETEQNYARMMRDTDQLIESLQNGGVVFRKTLEDEKKGLQDLLQVLPYMGTEYRKTEEQLQFLVKTTDEMAIKERQLKGEIVTTDDARRVSLQLTKEGAEAARQRAAAADMEIEKGKQNIETLEKEREEREKNARASAQAAAEYRENQQMYEDEIDRLQREIKAEGERAASGRTGVEAMHRKALAAGEAADKEIKKQKELDKAYETAKGKFMALREEYEKMKQTGAGAPAKDVADSAEKSIAEKTAEASKKKTEAKKEEVKVEKEAVEEQKKEVLSEKELEAALKENKKVIDGLYKERDELIKKQKESAQATREEASAFAELSKEQAEAMLKQKQATVTKGADGKFAYTNAEEAQHFLIESMRQANPANAKGDAISLDSAGVAKVRAMFKERYGITDDADALTAIRGLLSGENGGLIKGGMMNNAFSRIDLDVSKFAAYSKEIKDLTDVINGEVKATKEDSKAVEENAEKKRTLADVDAEIEAREKEQRQNAVLLIKMRNGLENSTSELSKKNEGLAESHKKSTAAIKEEIEAIKQMNREQAEAKKKEMTTTSTLGWKAGKLDASNLEEAQHYLLTQISKMGTVGKDGTYTLAGQNIDKLLTAFHNKYGEKGKLQESKALLKELVSGKNGGLFNEGGVVDFNSETLMIKANSEAYQGRLKVLKELISITNGTAQAVGKSTEATKKDTEATLSQTDAIKEQEAEVKRRKKAFDDANTDYDTKNAKLKDMRSALGRLPKSGPDALLARQQAQDEIDEYNENVVRPARADKTKLKGLWEKSVKDLLKMQGQDTEETKKNTEAENQNTEATENNTKSKNRKKKASEDAAKAAGEETQKSAELLAKEKEMKEAEAEMVAAMERGEAQQKKTNKAVEDAETANEKAKQSEVDLVKSLDEKSQKLKESKEGLENLNKANKDTIATNEKNQQLLAETNGKIQEQGEKIRDAERIKAQAKTDGIEKTEQAIRLLTEENRHIDQNSFTWKRNTVEIQHLQEALDEMKNKPVLMMMEQRMKNVGALSASAVTETKRFWEAMVAGAEKGSEKLATAEANVKAITEEEQKRSRAALEQRAGRLKGDMGQYSISEIQEGIEAAKKLQTSYKTTDEEVQTLSKSIVQAEQYISQYSVEAERAAQRQAEQIRLMQEQLGKGDALTESALKAQANYWQRLIDDPKTAADALEQYKQNLKTVGELQADLSKKQNVEQADKLLHRGYLNLSEDELQKAITGAREYQKTLQPTEDHYKTMSRLIIEAENHLKNYGMEAMRAANKQAEADALMQRQLAQGTALTESALKAQVNYWQRMADDPKTAADAVKQYAANLEKAQQLLKERIKVQTNEDAEKLLGDFTVLSEGELRKSIEAAKEYQKTLRVGENEHTQYSTAIAVAESHLSKFGLEAARANEKLIATNQLMEKQLGNGSISENALKAQVQYWQRLIDDPKTAASNVQEYTANLEKAKQLLSDMTARQTKQTAQGLLGDLNTMSEGEVRKAIEAAKQYQQTLVAGEEEHKKYSKAIVDAEEHLKQYGLEAERVQRKQEALDRQMRERMSDLPKLSESALQETKKYWEDMMRTQGKAEEKLSSYRIQLEKLIAEENRRKEVQAEKVIGNMSTSSDEEIRKAIQAFEQLRDAQAHGNDEWRYYNERVQEGKKYLEEWAQTDKVIKFEEQMLNLPRLSDAALQETKKFWETMVAGAEKGSSELREYEAHLEKVKQEERERKEVNNEQKAGIVRGESFNVYSLDEIRESIAAAKELHSHMASASPEAMRLAESIAKAEEHVKKYGGEAARTAQTNETMRQQFATMVNDMSRGIMPSASAVKAQQNYWKKLIEDPKTARESLQEYRDQLAEVEKMQEAMVKISGETAYQWFQNGSYKDASTNKVKEMAADLKAYRDSLPQETEAAKIQQIDQWLQKAGASAKKATQELMDFGDAELLAMEAGEDIYGQKGPAFMASPEEIQAATKSIEKYREELFKTIKAKRDSGEATDAEEQELKELAKYLKDLKFEQDNFNMSREKMETLMKTPVSAANLEELRAAIKRADAELRRMEGSLAENSDKYKELAADVKNAKGILKEMEGQAKATTSAFDKAWSRLKTYVGLYVGASVAMNKLMGTMGDLMDLSDKMGEVRKTTSFTADEVGRLSGELKKFDTRTTLNGLLDLSVAAGQLGLKTEEDVLGFTEAANKLMVALPEMGKEGATEMLKVALATGEIDKIRKQMEQGLIDGSSATAVAMEKVGSTIDRLRATSAATAPAITDFVKRVGAVGAQSGITIDQVAALGSTVDALGMRVEMSATALSRMIPAIKNNAFALAQAIGVTPETIRNLFDTGRGMEVILMVLQRIKDSGMDADSIENMLGMAGMKDIMKDLNQQGARAGIVFAGLSQNVDTLRKHLVTANEAYEENIAIQQEYDKMNETTAARWERLKNQLEETFVGDGAQRFLGGIIDGLRWIIDILTGSNGVSVALRSVLLYLGLVKLQIVSIASGALKSIWAWLKNIAVMLGVVKGEMTKLQWGNIFTAAAGAVVYFVMSLKDAAAAVSSVSKAIGQLEESLRKEIGTLEELFHAVSKTNVELEKSRSRLEEVKKAGGDATDAENKLKKANADHAATIREINSKYGTYLGYMLSETSSAEQLARARELINSKLRETITLKQREAALGNVEQEFGGNVNKKAASVERTLQTLFGSDYNTAARVSVAISEAAQKYANNSKEYQKAVKKILADNKIQEEVSKSYMETFEGYRKSIDEYKKQEDIVNRRFEAQVNVTRKDSREKAVASLNAILKDWKELVTKYQKAEGEEKEKLAAEVYKQQRNYANSLANNAEYFDNDKRKEIFDKNVKNMAAYEKGLRSVAGEAIRTIDAMERAETKVTDTDFTNGGESANNPWGKALEAESTDWKNMTAEQLVNRRKQMKDFVNAIQTDTDVQSVLKEDAALKKAIENGMSSDMRTVIEWYNTERLKIQDELHARHLTNTGDWMDPKKQKGAKKQFRDEMDAYLHELDAYYTERKTRIEEAGTDEGLTEAEIRNRTLNNEMEWQQRRAELQKLYSRKQKDVTQEELDAIYHIIAERTGDSESFVKAQIAKTNQFVDSIEKSGEKGAAIVHRWMSQVELDTERSYLKGQQALTKQMRAIEAIIDKERPFNGITKQLQENLSTMDVLTGEMRKEYNELMKQGKDMTDFNNRQAQEEMKRTAFLLGEAENAYSTTIDNVMDDMRQKGMTAWADWLSADPKLQEALMAQLHSTYDAIQDAIKKEASLMKKQAENMWNSILLPGGDGKTTVKDAFEKTIAQLGIEQGRVSRANSLIGAGTTSERVADRLAIRQMKLQLTMQQHYYNLMRKQGMQRIQDLQRQIELAKQEGDIEKQKRLEMDKQHVDMSLRLAMTKEQNDLLKQQEEIIARTEESQNRLYTALKEWGDLLTGSVREIMEATHAGEEEYYNSLAMYNLTGKGGPGAGTYVVTEDAGKKGATAHYEYLSELEAIERQREIERQNAQAEAWKKVMDDLNTKMNDQVRDWINAVVQNVSVDANTQAVIKNTEAIAQATAAMKSNNVNTPDVSGMLSEASETGKAGDIKVSSAEQSITQDEVQAFISGMGDNPMLFWAEQSDAAAKKLMENNKKVEKSTKASFTAMAAAANMYGIAYQTMANDNLSTTQKVEMMIVQAAGQAAISMLTASMAAATGETAANAPAWISKTLKDLGPIGGPVAVGVFTALIGGLMGLATSKISKSKTQIAQATGASASAGKLTTGMLTYAEGNVNEFSDPGSLTPGRMYNVDAADGRTYRAKYTGTNPRTHLTNGPEFHLAGERGREMIIDAGTTRQITMNEGEIWHAIKTLSGGGRMRRSSRRGVKAFADGNVEDFEEMGSAMGDGSMDLTAIQDSLDRNSAIQEALLQRLNEPIVAQNVWTGPDGIPNMYNKMQKEAKRHGVKFL